MTAAAILAGVVLFAPDASAGGPSSAAGVAATSGRGTSDGPLGPPRFEPDVFGGYASDHIIVRLAPGAGVPAAGRTDDHALPQLSGQFHDRCRAWGVTGVRRCFQRAFARPDVAADLGLDRTLILEVPAGTDALAMAEAFAELGDEVESAGVDPIGSVAFVPNDADLQDQWAINNTGQTGGTVGVDIDAFAAWDVHTGGDGDVTIAIIDSGVDLHTDFAAHVIGGTNTAVPGSTILSDNQADPPGLPCPHGTHVTGIAAAIGNNGTGVAGINWGANILRVKALNSCSGVMMPVADGVIWATDNGADVINISLQFYNLTPTALTTFESAIDYAYNAGVLVVAAAGNQHGFDVAHPAEFANCMAISASDHNDNRYVLSNYGIEIVVAAPGASIWSTISSPSNSYGFNSGTSMASPHVAGLASLIKSYLPGMTNDDLWDMIVDTSDDLGPPGFDIDFGWGRINAGNAMAAAAAVPRIVSSWPPDGAIDARQPSELDGSGVTGWQTFEVELSGDTSAVAAADFVVLVDGEASGSPAVAGVADAGGGTFTIALDGPIPVGSWTTIRHQLTGTSFRVGYLPGDVNGDGVSSPSDILSLIDGLNGVWVMEAWQGDIDRSGLAGPEDILRVIDLLNGAGSFDAYIDVSLP